MTTPVTPVATTSTTAQPTATTTGNTQLSSQAFLKLLVAQLQYQDPSSPTDMNSFMNQTATLNQMQTMQQLASVTSDLLHQTQTSQALSLVGKTVTYTGSDGHTATGNVTAVSLTTQPPALTINDQTVPLSSVTTVS